MTRILVLAPEEGIQGFAARMGSSGVVVVDPQTVGLTMVDLETGAEQEAARAVVQEAARVVVDVVAPESEGRTPHGPMEQNQTFENPSPKSCLTGKVCLTRCCCCHVGNMKKKKTRRKKLSQTRCESWLEARALQRRAKLK
jgi:hypothetical protein